MFAIIKSLSCVVKFMTKFKKTICILLTVITVSLCFSSCTAKGKSIHFYYPFSGQVNSFDPQVASTSDEFLIIENSYEGLIRVNDDGTVVPAAAERWEISADKKTYTFYLRQNAVWHVNKEVKEKLGEKYAPAVTADDFVFALERAVSPQTQAPLYPTVASIVNAPAVYSGKKEASSLGVSALDDYTLQINLSAEDPAFLSTLATAVAMPCNREFFSYTGGRYGLELEYTLSNGQFYVANILDTSYLLDSNDSYNGNDKPVVSDLTFNIDTDDANIADKLETGYYDAAFINGTDLNGVDSTSKTYGYGYGYGYGYYGYGYGYYCDDEKRSTWKRYKHKLKKLFKKRK